MAPLWPGLLFLLALPANSNAALDIRGTSNDCFVRSGDILLGLIRGIHNTGPSLDEPCLPSLRSISSFEQVEAFIYAIEKINANGSILPNVTIGFVIMDDCGSLKTHMAQSVYMIPDTDSPPPREASGNCSGGMAHFRTVGVIGSSGSYYSVATANMFSMAEIPYASTFATSDELSDQSRFEYFIRMSPPDRYQSNAILDLLLHYNWTYFSLLYSEGSYGENGAKNIENRVKMRGLCLAYSSKMKRYMPREEAEHVVSALLMAKTRAVVLFGGAWSLTTFFSIIEEQGLNGHFVFIGSDALSLAPSLFPAADGAFVIHFLSAKDPDFDDYYTSLTPERQFDNPWIREVWAMLYDCEWKDSSNDSCSGFKNQTVPSNYRVGPNTYKTLDAVYTLILGLDSLLKDKCPGVFSNKSLLADCLEAPDYLKHIKSIDFLGIAGQVKFDALGEMVGQYELRQYLADESRYGETVGRWQYHIKNVQMYPEAIDWSFFKREMTESGYPESVCSHPCEKFQYKIQKELMCCWECRSCRQNEILVDNYTSCRECDLLTWPDDGTQTVCEDIAPVYMRISDPITVGFLVITSLGIVAVLVISGLFYKNKHCKLIKASGRDLMTLIMSGILLAYITIFLIIVKPTYLTCMTSRLGFNISVCLIFAPLFVKTNRVYRIFSAGRRGKTRPGFISSKAQLTASLVLFAGQVIISLVNGFLNSPNAALKMPLPSERYVELVCDMPLAGFTFCLSYNLIFILLCALFGFLTRKLPENFNESWYIFVSVSTTTFLWLVFLPTYFTAFYAYHQSSMLAFCLFLNASVILLCLCLPKLYAIYFVSEDDMKFISNMTNSILPTQGTGQISISKTHSSS